MMEHPGFFERAGPFALSVVAEKVGATIAAGADPALPIRDVKPLSDAGAGHLSFLDNRKYLPQLADAKAAAILIAPIHADRIPPHAAALSMKRPYHGFALALALFYPQAMRSKAAESEPGDAAVHPTARIEAGVRIEPGAVIGREAWIGAGTVVAANAVIGYRVTVGRGCWIGPGATVLHALIGNTVIVHAGVRIGQDGFGFAMGPGGHLKVPQIGRVIVQDNVEIGANSAIDRGALKDTIIGEGTKIDNLVQIGHNVVVGRHCVIVGQVGIAGSSERGDFGVIGGQGGGAGHLAVGAGAQIAGASHVIDDVAPRAKMVGTPAVPIRDWTRTRLAMARLTGGPTASVPARHSEDDGA